MLMKKKKKKRKRPMMEEWMEFKLTAQV